VSQSAKLQGEAEAVLRTPAFIDVFEGYCQVVCARL